MGDELLDPGANWCPVCGEMRGVCRCDESDFMPEAADDWDDDDTYYDSDDELEYCEYCSGSGFVEELLGECPECDGMGYKWWL